MESRENSEGQIKKVGRPAGIYVHKSIRTGLPIPAQQYNKEVRTAKRITKESRLYGEIKPIIQKLSNERIEELVKILDLTWSSLKKEIELALNKP